MSGVYRGGVVRVFSQDPTTTFLKVEKMKKGNCLQGKIRGGGSILTAPR